MCFPTLKQSFCCCSLRTGMYYICSIGILWNSYFLLYRDPNPPDFLKFLDSQYLFFYGSSGHFTDNSTLYYGIQIFAMFFAFFGISSDSLCCLTPLLVSEALMILMYSLSILTYLVTTLCNTQSKENLLSPLILLAFHYYLCSIILSFYKQVSRGEDGREQGVTASSPSASAPCPNDQISPGTYVNSPYVTQPPYAPVMTQPCMSMYPPNEYSQTAIPPSSCYMPQSMILNEKPPPYAR